MRQICPPSVLPMLQHAKGLTTVVVRTQRLVSYRRRSRPSCKSKAPYCIFATDGILEQNSVRRTFKCVATVTCLIMAAPHWCFYGVQWLFIHVIYIKCLGFWLERKDSWKKKFRPSQWWPILDLAHVLNWHSENFVISKPHVKWKVVKHKLLCKETKVRPSCICLFVCLFTSQ